jgi:hypothetical protein
MKARDTLALRARRLLAQSARRLGTADPLDDVGAALDEQLDVPYGEPTDDAPLSTQYSEQTPEHLNFVMRAAGRGVTGADRIESSSQAMARVVDRHFGRAARRWLDNQLEPVRGQEISRGASWGAAFGSAFDRNGLAESYVHCEWGPSLLDSLPAPLHRLVRTVVDTMPGLHPVILSVRCGRSAGAQQLSFESERPLALAALQPLMDELGLGHRHAGVELRLDVSLDDIPDLPSQLMALTRLQMTERPRSVQGMDRWLMALTPDGYPGPGTVSVLSVWVRPDLPARVALYLRPASLDPRLEGLRQPAAAPRQAPASAPSRPPGQPETVAGQALWSSSAWA